VTSGTATLETALFGVPEVVCYKGNPISYQIAKRLVRVPYISLVNLIMDREVVRELIQDEMNAEQLCRELKAILHDGTRREQLAADYAELHDLLAAGGHASGAAADSILNLLAEH
jgi:lipid-A-disaccharide synthase